MAEERRLAAIMFTDIVGYTALMGSDEDRAFEVLRKNREIHDNCLKRFNGTLIKEMGDGMMVSFNLASEAVRCAVAIQKEALKQQIPLKVGIHEGEMVFEGADVFGDGVNIASRLQDATGQGCINISGSVYRDVKNKKDIYARFIRDQEFKNVDEPLKVYQVYLEKPSDEVQNLGPRRKQSGRRKATWLSISSTVIVSVAIIIIFLFYRARSVPFAEREWILITDFQNLTQEPIFDHSLSTAFSLSIDQSRYINVITAKRLREALKRMKMEDREFIDEETGREVAIREGVKICIVPSISRVGDQYILTANIQEATTAVTLKSEVLYADSKDEIIEKLDKLSKWIRRNLGESRYEILEQSKPLSKVTTSSLDALKQFSLGIEKHINLNFSEAIVHYEEAIRIDTNFTSAKASLGNLLFLQNDRERGLHYLNKAIASIDDLSDKEKYGILAFYASNVENDLKKAIDYTQARLELYPDDPIPHNNQGWYYQNMGRYDKSLGAYKTALRLDPYMMLAYTGVNWIYQGLSGQLDSAYVWANRMMEFGPDNPWGYYYLGSYYAAMNDLEMAEKYYLQATTYSPIIRINQYRLAHVYRLLKKYDKAIEVFESILENNKSEVIALYNLGITHAQSGDEVLAESLFRQFLKYAEDWKVHYSEMPDTYVVLGNVLTRLGEKEAGWEEGTKAIELDSTFHFRYAEFLTVNGRIDEALNHLEKALMQGSLDLAWIRLNPDLQAMYSEPRFTELTKKYFRF